MSYSNIYQPCDHVTVQVTSESKQSDNSFHEWAIPEHYFSNQRGTLCSIQLVTGALSQHNSQKGFTSVYLASGSANGFSIPKGTTVVGSGVQLPSTPCLAIGSDMGSNFSEVLNSAGEFLIGARPLTLRLNFLFADDANDTSRFKAPPTYLVGTLTFKFTYYDAVGSAVNLHDKQNYKTL